MLMLYLESLDPPFEATSREAVAAELLLPSLAVFRRRRNTSRVTHEESSSFRRLISLRRPATTTTKTSTRGEGGKRREEETAFVSDDHKRPDNRLMMQLKFVQLLSLLLPRCFDRPSRHASDGQGSERERWRGVRAKERQSERERDARWRVHKRRQRTRDAFLCKILALTSLRAA